MPREKVYKHSYKRGFKRRITIHHTRYYILMISRYRKIFKNRKIIIASINRDDVITVPDGLIVCDVCGNQINTDNVLFLMIGRHPWGAICEQCRQRYHPKLPIITASET